MPYPLDIDAPATADRGTGTPGTPLSGSLGPVTVTDSRASADGGRLAATTGNGPCTPGQSNAPAAAPLDNVAPLTALVHTGGTGRRHPHRQRAGDSVAGAYTGTGTPSVA